jgi:hypothetical protein
MQFGPAEITSALPTHFFMPKRRSRRGICSLRASISSSLTEEVSLDVRDYLSLSRGGSIHDEEGRSH